MLATTKTIAARRHDLDWLRVFAILSVFLYHNTRFFDFEDWHVKNPQLSTSATMAEGFLGIWIMPLMFVISGAATCWALGGGAGRFLGGKVNRLLIPLAFGIFALALPQVYLERLSHGQFRGSLLDFLPHYFDGWYGFGGNFAWMGLHLWYLLMLFLFSVIMLPAFLYLRSEGGRRALSGLARLLDWPGAIFLLAIPPIFFETGLDPDGAGLQNFGGWTIFTYLVLFIYGYLIFSEPRLERALYRHGSTALALALASTLGLAFASPVGSDIRFGTSAYILASALETFASWCWVLAFFGLARRLFSFNSCFLAYANEAVLPFYMLHQTVIIIAGYSMAGWGIDVLPKALVLASVSFAIILGIYELLVRRIEVLRFLFGLKPSRGKQAAQIRPTPAVHTTQS
jgi:peptidoglycan/LPS O-acetylase OafA/YrhL